MAKSATANAALFGGIGRHYPWESAFSGAEVTQNTCPADQKTCNWNRMYVTAAVNWAIRQYYSLTRDRDYMINPDYAGCDVTRETAKFLANQAVYNQKNARYDMNGMRFLYETVFLDESTFTIWNNIIKWNHMHIWNYVTIWNYFKD